jgi:hypothetical protein
MKQALLIEKQVLSVSDVRILAVRNYWIEINFQKKNNIISFKKNDIRMNIYLLNSIVSTSMNHPKHGKTQLFRYKCSLLDVNKIMKNPRIHTGKGYYRNYNLNENI